MGRNKEQAACYAAEDSIWRKFKPSRAAHEWLVAEVSPATGKRSNITYHDAGEYIAYVQRQDWFRAAFPNQGDAISVVGGGGSSYSMEAERKIKIAADHRHWTSECEWVCLHELAHMVTRKPPPGTDALAHFSRTRGHTHAWRVNYVRIVRGQIGDRAANALWRSFEQHEVRTHR